MRSCNERSPGIAPLKLTCKLTLGGGLGFLSGQHGLVIDNLVGATVVLANGNVVQWDAEAHPDVSSNPCSYREPVADMSRDSRSLASFSSCVHGSSSSLARS